MSQKFLLLITLSILGQTLATPSKLGRVLMDNRFYTIDITANRNRAQALALCETKGGELAKMTGKPLFNVIQASTTSTGGYWIDGMDKPTPDRFAASTNCTSSGLEFKGLEEKLDLLPLSCLIFNKGANAATTKIMAVSCTSVHKGVICATPINDCEVPPVEPPTSGEDGQ